jgi:PST family polysaccharide transporter
VAAGAGWIYGYRWGGRLLDLISIVVLARLLAPEDFGLVAIAASIVAIVEGLSDFDVNKALIRTRGDERELYDSAWTLSTLRGLLTALAMLAISWLVSEPRIAEVLRMLALSPLLTGLANPRFVAFERDLVYSRLAAQTLGAKIASFAVTLAAALLLRSYWALVLGILANSLVTLLLSYSLRPYLPRPTLARGREILSFSGWLSLTTMVTTLSMETDKIIVGRLLGVAEAGLYFMTQRVGVLPTRELISPLQRVLFPSFSEIAEDRERLKRVVRESINVVGSLSLPAGVGFALVSDDVVPVALGEQWLAIVPLLQVLVPYLGVRATLSMVLPCVMAQGRTRLLFRVSALYAVVHLPLFIAGTALYGLPGSIWSIVVAGVFYTYLNVWLLRHTLGVSAAEIGRQLKRPLVATVVMTAALLALGAVSFSWPARWVGLVIEVAAGGLAYAAMLLTLWRLGGRPPGIESRLAQLLPR